MFKRLQNLAKRESSGALSGKQLAVGAKVVRVDRLLGEGGFATIYRCTDVETGAVYALKHYILTGYPDAERDASTEVGVMEALAGCPHAVRLHEAALGGPPGAPPTAAFALLEFCPDTLPAYLAARSWRLDDGQLLRVALPVARAVAAMHALQPPLAHRDLKAENVLLNGAGQWVLCDFGSACARQGVLSSAAEIAMEEEVVRRYTTPAYRAPELYDLYAREHVGLPVDVWALGVLLYLLAFGRLPFEGEAKLQVLNGRYTMPEGQRPEPLRALIRDCLTPAPLKRPSIQAVVRRLEALAPPELLQELGAGAPAASAAQAQPAATAASAASGTGLGAPLHSRIPSQGWADFGSDVGSAASPVSGGGSSGPPSRHHSGSVATWATFSPKRAAEVAAGAVSAEAADAGSFWSSFGEEAPSEAQEQAAQQQQQQQQPQPPQQAAAPPAPAAAPAAQAAPRQQAATDVINPLSAGLARMNLSGPAAPQRQPPAAARAVQGEGQGGGGGSELDMLREHSRVLEQLLQEKTEEIVLLRRQAEHQAAEIQALRQRAQQAEAAAARAGQQPAASVAASVAGTASAAGGVASTPSSSRMGQDAPSLQVPGSGESWISFGGGGGGAGDDAPTPTLLQPATGSSFRGSTDGGSAAAGGPAATPFSAPHPSEEALRARLDLSSAALTGVGAGGRAGARASAGLLVTPQDGPLRQPPMRTNSGSRLAGAGSSGAIALSGASSGSSVGGGGGGGSGGPQSFPVVLTPGPSPLAVEGSRSAPPSAKPSPSRPIPVAPANGGGSPPAQPCSPKQARPGSSLSGRSLSPTKGHRRNLTAPGSGFFDDLDPLSQ